MDIVEIGAWFRPHLDQLLQHAYDRNINSFSLKEPYKSDASIVLMNDYFWQCALILADGCFGTEMKSSSSSDWVYEPDLSIGTPDTNWAAENIAIFAAHRPNIVEQTGALKNQDIFRQKVLKLTIDFWRDLPRSAAEVGAFREKIINLGWSEGVIARRKGGGPKAEWQEVKYDESWIYELHFAKNLSARSSFGWVDRILRDFQLALDWCALTQLWQFEAELQRIASLDLADEEKARLFADAHCSAKKQLALGLSYVVLDVLSADAHTVGVDLSNRGPESPGARPEPEVVDVTDLIRNHLLDIIKVAVDASAYSSSITADDYALIDLWREGGGREAVFAEYPFWLKHDD